ncbi:MAG: hemolysin family protein [Crocinitomicaceae bacterium]|nr:hemolysin family protein [Crocinitomicaceae bacterium]
MDITEIGEPLFFVFISLLFSAFFSGMEIAFISSNRLKVELDKSSGGIKGRLMTFFYSKESMIITSILVGNNLSLVVFGISSAKILSPIILSWGVQSEALVLFLQTILSTILVLIIAEFMPKTIVQLNPNRSLKLGSSALFVSYLLFYIPSKLIFLLSNSILGKKGEIKQGSPKIFGKVDLEHFINDLNERIDEEEHLGNEIQILQNALDFSSVKARECMVPRTEVVSIDVTNDVQSLSKLFSDTGLSKIIVYRDSIDNIIGYVHSFDLFKTPEEINHILLPIAFVPSAISGSDLLKLFTKQTGNIAVVVDEYGGTAGIVTIEDVIEEIFGEIEDEHDKEILIEEKISENEFRFSARQDIDYLNKEYEFDIEESEEYETLGGFLIHKLETIPKSGETVKTDQLTIIVEKVSDRRIEVARVLKK